MIYGDEVRTNLTTSSRPGFLFRTSRDPGSAIWLCSGCGSGGRTASTASTVCTSVVSRCRVHYAFDASHLQITMYRQLDTGCECDVFEIFIPECPMRLYTRLHESMHHHRLISMLSSIVKSSSAIYLSEYSSHDQLRPDPLRAQSMLAPY